MNSTLEIAIPYSAMAISISARFIFIYLLYTKKSVNNLSLAFCLLNIASSSLWLKYSLSKGDTPLLLRSSADIGLFVLSASYIARNKLQANNARISDIEQGGRGA